ncbi:MAG: 30S ribosomal protein S4 [Chlamydiia bacterium]|nr:30S ribosomal protein S4 [Chlamydiia bacterium]MCH9629899.1 30S ribosomal protein S4 [Chlamydiia bacterium]
MARYTGPKNRIARRFGANVFGKLRNPLLHKPHPPGMHGARRRKKSDYGLQLDEKQKLKAVYGMLSDKQLLKYYNIAMKKEGNTAHVLMELLESRLDVVVYRMGLAATIFHAQQLVVHGHVLVNGKKVDIRSFQVKGGSTVALREKSKNNPLIKHLSENQQHETPDYLSVDLKSLKGELNSTPIFDQIPLPLPINVALVCEFLAHTH